MTKSQLIRALQPYLRRKPKIPIQPKAAKSTAASSGSSKRSIYNDLPWSYGKTELVLIPVDPFLIHAYWDFSIMDWEAVQAQRRPVVLRIYDVTMIEFDGTNAHHYSDVPVSLEAQNWYIPIGSPDKFLCADLGWLLPDGSFKTMVRSNIIQTPRAGISVSEESRWIEIRSGRRKTVKDLTGIYGSKQSGQTLAFWKKLERQASGLTAGKAIFSSQSILPIQSKLPV